MADPGSFRREIPARLNVLQGELNRLAEQYWPLRVRGTRDPAMARSAATWSPEIDLYETPEEIVLLADLPGVDPSAIELTIEGLTLTLQGEKVHKGPEGPGPRSPTERPFGPFRRQVDLSCSVDLDGIEAGIRDGVLRIRLPKDEAVRTREIPIRSP